MNELERIGAELLAKDFELTVKATWEEQRQQLEERVVFLLLNQMEKLMQILYKIDVNERKVKDVFAQNDPKLIAPQLTDLILNRILQKAETRKNFNA